MDGDVNWMSDCAEGAEDHPVTHFIKKKKTYLKGKVLLLSFYTFLVI